MKTVAIIIIVILIAVALVLIFSPKPPQDTQQLQVEETNDETQEEVVGAVDADGRVELTDFSYVGYGPGKSHNGVFERYEIKNVRLNADGVPVGGELVIDTTSVKTDTAMLDDHLRDKAEFFDSAKYPNITFKLANVTKTADGVYQVTGDLTVKDVTKKVGFTVNASETDKTFSSEFRLNMNEFGFTAPGIVDEEVLVRFVGKIN